MNDVDPPILMHGLPVDPPRKLTPMLKLAPLVMSPILLICWTILGLAAAGVLWSNLSDSVGDPASNSKIITVIGGVILAPFALYAYLRGFRPRSTEVWLARNGLACRGRLGDFDMSTMYGRHGQSVTSITYTVNYDSQFGGSGSFKQHMVLQTGQTPMTQLMSEGYNPEAIPVLYDRNDLSRATSPINMCCRFDENGRAVPRSMIEFFAMAGAAFIAVVLAITAVVVALIH